MTHEQGFFPCSENHLAPELRHLPSGLWISPVRIRSVLGDRMLPSWRLPGISPELVLSADSHPTSLPLLCLSVSILFPSHFLPIYPRQLCKSKCLICQTSNTVCMTVMEIEGQWESGTISKLRRKKQVVLCLLSFLMIFTGARPTGYVGKYITKEADVRFSW